MLNRPHKTTLVTWFLSKEGHFLRERSCKSSQIYKKKLLIVLQKLREFSHALFSFGRELQTQGLWTIKNDLTSNTKKEKVSKT